MVQSLLITHGDSVLNGLLGVCAELQPTGDHCRVSNISVMENFDVQRVGHPCRLFTTGSFQIQLGFKYSWGWVVAAVYTKYKTVR